MFVALSGLTRLRRIIKISPIIEAKCKIIVSTLLDIRVYHYLNKTACVVSSF